MLYLLQKATQLIAGLFLVVYSNSITETPTTATVESNTNTLVYEGKKYLKHLCQLTFGGDLSAVFLQLEKTGIFFQPQQ